jgi:hypothetical protein
MQRASFAIVRFDIFFFFFFFCGEPHKMNF